jgi:hypothetical protein
VELKRLSSNRGKEVRDGQPLQGTHLSRFCTEELLFKEIRFAGTEDCCHEQLIDQRGLYRGW